MQLDYVFFVWCWWLGALAVGASVFCWDSSGPMEKEAVDIGDWLARFDLTFSPCPFIFLVLTLFLYIIFPTLYYNSII